MRLAVAAIPLSLDAGGHWFRAFRVNDVPTVIVADASGLRLRRVNPGNLASAAALKTAMTRLT